MVQSKSERVALVTGAASGIGREIAIQFAYAGLSVAIIDNDKIGLNETHETINSLGVTSLPIYMDVSVPAEAKMMIDNTIDMFGRLDFAVNNAGVEGPGKSIIKYDDNDFISVINVNLYGTWLCMKYELIEMVKSNFGVIINVASVLGRRVVKNASAYIASKHAIIGVTKSAALEYGHNGIRVNTVSPGSIETPMFKRVRSNNPALLDRLKILPIRRTGSVTEVAKVVLWLCSDDAQFITGEDLVIDGGSHLI